MREEWGSCGDVVPPLQMAAVRLCPGSPWPCVIDWAAAAAAWTFQGLSHVVCVRHRLLTAARVTSPRPGLMQPLATSQRRTLKCKRILFTYMKHHR